jgi:hypothetical protein
MALRWTLEDGPAEEHGRDDRANEVDARRLDRARETDKGADRQIAELKEDVESMSGMIRSQEGDGRYELVRGNGELAVHPTHTYRPFSHTFGDLADMTSLSRLS